MVERPDMTSQHRMEGWRCPEGMATAHFFREEDDMSLCGKITNESFHRKADHPDFPRCKECLTLQSAPPATSRPYQIQFVISDTHFNHSRIKGYASRPYRTTYGMNKSMIRKWNQSVFPQDTVYFLGDFAWSHIGSFITKLNGHKVFIRGNHDRRVRGTKVSDVATFEDHTFLLIHNPEWVQNWSGWVIHGHVHDKKPFIDLTEQRVNVSVEVVGYRPISLHRIVQTIRAMKKTGITVARDRKHAASIRRMAYGTAT